MFGGMRYRYKLWKLGRVQKAIRKEYGKKQKEAEQRKAIVDEHRELSELEMHESMQVYKDKMMVRSNRLIEIASRLFIPVPSPWDPFKVYKWEEDMYGRKHLTQESMHELKMSIRAERKAKWELIVMWFPFISVIVGLIGAATGLVAVFRSVGH
jgi:hypothetical protein